MVDDCSLHTAHGRTHALGARIQFIRHAVDRGPRSLLPAPSSRHRVIPSALSPPESPRGKNADGGDMYKRESSLSKGKDDFFFFSFRRRNSKRTEEMDGPRYCYCTVVMLKKDCPVTLFDISTGKKSRAGNGGGDLSQRGA